jgi:hypothetical protein
VPELDLQADPREIITRMWPEHAKHLSPAGNTMGGGKIDPDEGVVCNCGQVLGFPTVQDEADYVMAEPERPDTSGAQDGEPDEEPDDTPVTYGEALTALGSSHDEVVAAAKARLSELDWDGPIGDGPQGPSGPHAAPSDNAQANERVREGQEGIDSVDMDDRRSHDTSAEYHEGEHGPEPDWTPQLPEREHATDPDGDMPEGWQDAAAAGWAENLIGQAYAMGHAAGERAADPEQPLPCERSPQPHLISEHRGEETTADEAGWNDLVSDEAQAGGEIPPDGPPKGVMPWRDQGVVPAEDPIAARVVVIDPTLPYGPRDVEQQLLDIAGRIERGVHYQRYWEEREFAAESVYTNKSARARWDSRGSGAKDVRDAAVQMACEEEWQELLLCRAMVKAVKETMHNLRSLQSGYQSVARSVNESTRNPAGSYGRA